MAAHHSDCPECKLSQPHYCKCDTKQCVVATCGRVQEERHENMYCDRCYACKVSQTLCMETGRCSYSVPLCSLCEEPFMLQDGVKSECGRYYVLCGKCGKTEGPWMIGWNGPRPKNERHQ
jgi:hypothetical protein